jgi:hypothetical protein
VNGLEFPRTASDASAQVADSRRVASGPRRRAEVCWTSTSSCCASVRSGLPTDSRPRSHASSMLVTGGNCRYR